MKIKVLASLFGCLLSGVLFAQEVYGVFGLPDPELGHRQVGTINPSTGAIGLLGNSTSVETGDLDMTTGATALNVTANLSYFVARNDSNEDLIYTVDLTNGTTTANPILTAGYTTSNNWGVWYDESNAVLYGLFDRGVNIEIAVINPTTGAVTPHHDTVEASGATLGSGLMTGDSANNRIFVIIEASLYVIATDSTDTHYALLLENFWEEYTPSTLSGLEWDSATDSLWFLYLPGGGARKVIGFNTIEDGGEPEQLNDIELEFGDPITTGSGLTTIDSQTGKFLFIGRPNGGAYSLFSVDMSDGSYTITDIEDVATVQTNGYQGIEVLPGPELSLTKSDGGITAVPGGTISYTLDYSNAPGTGATSGLTLTETVPANTTFLPGSSTGGWSCLPTNNAGSACTLTPAELGPGGSAQATFAVQVVDYVTSGTTTIDNQASVTANNTAENIQSSTMTAVTSAAVLSLSKTDNDVTNTTPGDSIIYQLSLSNSGNQVSDQTVITETVPSLTSFNAGLSHASWVCADVIAGSNCTLNVGDLAGTAFDASFVVDVIPSVPAGTTEVSNNAAANADNATEVLANDVTPIVSSPNLSYDFYDYFVIIEPEQSVVYDMVVVNNGNQDASNVKLSAFIHEQTTFDNILSANGWLCTPNQSPPSLCEYSLGVLAGGTQATIQFSLNLNNPIDHLLVYLNLDTSVESDNHNTVNPSDNITPIVASPNLRLIKTDGGITAGLDRVINYTLIYFNDGNRNAIDVELTETVPDHTTFQPASSSPGWSCTPNNQAGSSCTLALNDLNGGEKGSAFFAVKTDERIFGQVTELSNTATLTSSNAPASDSDTVITPIDISPPRLSTVRDNLSGDPIRQCLQYGLTTNQLKVTLIDNQGDLQGLGDFNNYYLVNAGPDHDIQSLSCGITAGDDSEVFIANLSVSDNSDMPEITIELEENLQSGVYALLLCDGITDAAGNNLNFSDSYYWDNDHLIHPFRIELENLFENAYFDECGPIGIDPPPPFWEWQLEGDMQTTVHRYAQTDFNDAFISRSMGIESSSGSDVGASQCQAVNSGWPYHVGASLLGDLMQGQDGEINIRCESSSQPDCSDVLSTDEMVMTQMTAPGQWLSYESVLWTDPSAVAARCSVTLSNAAEAAMGHFDEFKWKDADLIFANGFEAQ